MGYAEQDVLGKPCYEVVAGDDLCGHPVCRRGCPVTANARRGRVTAPYDVVAPTHSGRRVWLTSTVLLVTRGEERSEPLLIHQLREHPGVPAMQPQPTEGGAEPRRRTSQQPVPPVGQPVSRRELEILRLLVAGQTTAEIAETLTISRYTARNHIINLLRKLGARNRVEAILLASHHGLI